MKLKNFLLLGLVVIILALDWAALHDILKGESDLILEYSMIVFSLIVIALITVRMLKARNRTSAES